MLEKLRYLLLQVRNPDDPMRRQEVESFARVLQCEPAQIATFDLLSDAPSPAELEAADMLLLGGSGHYSATGEGAWIERALDALRDIHARGKPTFASCWGFQAMARAMGGRVINDPANAELGTIELFLTPAGEQDPVFGSLGSPFLGQAGHEDHVVELPPDAVLLASSRRVAHQAYRFPGLPIYCTQFHPELNIAGLLSRLRTYPEYVERIAGVSYDQFASQCQESDEAAGLLLQFIREVFGGA